LAMRYTGIVFLCRSVGMVLSQPMNCQSYLIASQFQPWLLGFFVKICMAWLCC